ncbi:MAG: hypothetical protein Fur0012_02280 [Elusimicrobiota bacterium]
MKKLLTFVLAVSFSSAYSQNLNNSDFGNIDLKASNLELRAPQAEKAGSIEYSMTVTSNLHILSQTGKNSLFAFMDTEEQYREYLSFWNKILSDNGFKVVSSEFSKGMAKINYSSEKGLVIRNFWADGLNYDAKNENEITKLKDELSGALYSHNMKTVAAFRVNNDVFRPTFVLYYIARGEENPDHEINLRQLKKGEDIDFDLLADKVDIVRKDASFSLVYIGKELGFVSKLAADESSAMKKLEDYKKFLQDNKKEFINSKVLPLEEPFTVGDNTYKFLLKIYFFQ